MNDRDSTAHETQAEVDASDQVAITHTTEANVTGADIDGFGTVVQAQDGYIGACSALILAIATNTYLTDDEADALLEALPTADLQKQLIVGLKCHGLIPPDTAAFIIGYARDLRGA
jgi:hypothetical protein